MGYKINGFKEISRIVRGIVRAIGTTYIKIRVYKHNMLGCMVYCTNIMLAEEGLSAIGTMFCQKIIDKIPKEAPRND